MTRTYLSVPWALVVCAVIIEAGWIGVAAASLPLTDVYDFGAAVLGQTGGLWTWAIPLRRVPLSVPAALLVGALVMVTVGYLVAIALQLRLSGRFTPAWIVGLAVGFLATLLVMPGVLSSDVLTYTAYGRMGAVYGLNPYLSAPAAIDSDPIVQWLKGSGPGHASPYGPLWTALSVALGGATSGLSPLEQTLPYRLVGALAHLANCFLVWRLVPLLSPQTSRAEQLRDQRLALLIYCWNPLALMEIVGGGHNDGLMMTLVLAGLWLIVARARWIPALLIIWAGALVKWMPAVLVLYLGMVWLRVLHGWAARLLNVTVAAVLMIVLTLALFVPWFDGRDPQALLASASVGGERYVNSLVDLPTPWVAAHWLDPRGRDLQEAETTIRASIGVVVRVLFGAYAVYELVRLWTGRGDLRAALETCTRVLLVALLVVFTQVLPWYFVWPLALGTVLGWRSDVAKVAFAYSVAYLPIFYATHENLLTTLSTVPALLAYTLLPPFVVWTRRSGRLVPLLTRARTVSVTFRA